MADFRYFLNRQGIQGRKGDKGDTGFSPTISVGTDTLNEYKLIIANEVNSFETPNLRGNINVLDNGGTYLRYDAETQQISAQGLDAATSTTVGGVRMSTASDIETMGDNTVITPANLADALPVYLQGEGAVTITQDEVTSKTKINVDLSSVDELSTRVSNAETAIVGLQTDVANINSDISTLNSVTANNTASISSINNNITDLNNNKVAKTDFATTETAGIVKVDGTTITSTGDGTISANLNYTLPIASTTQLGGVKVDGTTITIDANGVISSAGGGGTGDVTAAGDNVFTGLNTFNGNNQFNANNNFAGWTSFASRTFFGDVISTANTYSSKDVIYFDTFTGNWESSSGDSFSKGYGLINVKLKQCELTTSSEESSTANLRDITLASSGDLILKANNNTIAGNISMSSIPRIKDGDGNIMLSQGNVTAGNNITIEKTDAGIKISSTASGGGGATIDDNNISTTTVYSSDKTVNLATNLVDNAMITLNQTKQDTLVSGTNIKTINGQSILGEGDITVGGSANVIDDSTASDTTTYSSNKITNLTSDLISNAADGQWVAVNKTLFSKKSWAVDSNEITYSLNDIIPNDGYNYEVLVSGHGNTGTTAGSQFTCAMRSSFVGSSGLVLYRCQTRTNSNIASGGCGIIPIGLDRNITILMTVAGSATGNTYGYVEAYRRIGKNQ